MQYRHKKLGVVECLDNDEMECCGKDFVAWLDEAVLALLENSDKDGFDVDFIHVHLLELLLK